MKIALVTANFPPKICGVGDHSFHLRNALRTLQYSVDVYSKTQSPEVSSIDELWQKSPKDYEVLLLQYTPYLYANRWGVSDLPSQLYPWKNRFFFLAHELHYPWQFSLAGTYLSLQHRIQFAKIQKLAKHTIYAYAKPIQDPKKESWLPVGSNIDPLGEKEGEIAFLHFGGAHPTHEYELLNAIASELHKAHHISEKIFCLGVTQQDLQKYGNLKYLEPLGKLSAPEASRWISSAKIILSPFLDGISTRRGSYMAALAHGKPVLTNLGNSSDLDIPWNEISAICEKTAIAYAERAAQWILHPEEAGKTAQKGQAYYQKNFDWPIIAKRLVQLF